MSSRTASLFRADVLAARLVLAGLMSVAVLGTATAQVGPGNAAKPNSTIPEETAPAPGTSTDRPVPASGVIRPKRDVDPGMTKIPPDKGSDTMPIIPPKGTPGGAPGPEPK
jgi:hypothetical protein